MTTPDREQAQREQAQYDVAVLGSGFAGSLLAILLQQQGLRTILLEKDRHPRFAIGESSTPLANLILDQFANQYKLEWLKPFCKYGPWKKCQPNVTRGLKRGFSFFRHTKNQSFHPNPHHSNELFVAANPDADRGDTHWLRSDFDAFLVDRAVEGGVDFRDRRRVVGIEGGDHGWRVCHIGGDESGSRIDGSDVTRCHFVVDATGGAGILASALGIPEPEPGQGFITSTRAIYGHFEDVRPFAPMLRDMGSISTDYPFDPDASALHHIIDWGWMWVLRFDNGVTSAGFSLQNHQYPLDTSISVEDEWAALLSTYPTIGEIFQGSRAVRELTRTGPMQRRLTRSAGRLEGATGTSPLAGGWAILPQGAAFVDPWLSPGISQSLICVARLARILGQSDGSILVDGLDDYERRMFAEADVVDDITSACMACFDQFQAMTAVSMLYFVAAIYVEESLRGRVASVTPVDGETLDRLGFLLAHENGYRKIVRKVCSQARNGDSAERIINTVGALLGDYDLVDLCDPARPNMHPYREFAGRPS